jgi:hypothetical protein
MKNQLRCLLISMMFFSASYAMEESDASGVPCTTSVGHSAPVSEELLAQRELIDEMQGFLSPSDMSNRVIREKIASGLAEDKYEFTRDRDALRKLAEAGWREAQRFVADGLAEGWYGFTQDLTELGRVGRCTELYCAHTSR